MISRRSLGFSTILLFLLCHVPIVLYTQEKMGYTAEDSELTKTWACLRNELNDYVRVQKGFHQIPDHLYYAILFCIS